MKLSHLIWLLYQTSLPTTGLYSNWKGYLRGKGEANFYNRRHFMLLPLQSCVWSMSCLRVRYCSICAVMC